MRKISVLTFLFFTAMVIGVQLRNKEIKKSQNELREEGEEERQGFEEHESHEDGPEEFLKFHLGIRTRSDEAKPSYPDNYKLIEWQKALQSSAKNRSNAALRTQSAGNGVTGYTERGPGNVPGRTRGLIVDPDDATHKTWYAGSASGGIWKTIDAGTSWQWLTPALPNLATTTLAMAGSNHNTIYAGAGEGFGLVDGVDGHGIFKSIDRGNSWAFLPNSSSIGDVNRLAVDPSNENNILAAANSGIYHSTDGGNSWTLVFNAGAQDLRATPGNFSVLYATQNATGVFKSIDGGNTWNASSTGMSPSGRIEIAVSPVNTNRIIASAQGSLSGGNSDLYVSDNAGATWYLVTLTLSNKTLDYLFTQGWYDNTVAFSPYDKDVVYVGGIGTYQVTLGSALTTSSGSYAIAENNTSSFLNLQNFNASQDGGKLDIGSAVNKDEVKVLFGNGITQKAHRFLVPVDSTTGVSNAKYTYQDYVDVPFQVWDVTTNQQLMVSFRDQNRNGVFDLITQNTTNSDATLQSREYVFINNVPYATSPNTFIATNGGQVYKEMYFFWPVLASTATWNPSSLPNSNLDITYSQISRYSSTVSSVADPYDDYDGKNDASYVHPDQHNIYPIQQNDATQTFQLLMANDGGVFLSGISTSPGTTQGEWTKVGIGYNTSQFYGADKKPGAQQYLGGMQDNSTYFTPNGTISSATTHFNTNSALAGDGFEALWHSLDGNKMIGGSQYNNFARSLDGGSTWSSAISGFPLTSGSPTQSEFPFISKLANSKQAPDFIYSVGAQGVWKSVDFGGTWNLTSITQNWGSVTSFADVEVSRANANIVWAGNGAYSGGNLFISTDAGKTFTSVPNPAGYVLGNVSRIATHPTNEKIAYVLFSFANTAKILMTQDLGQTWTDISGFGTGQSSTTGFPDVAVYCLYVRPDNTNIIWAGTEIGIIESLDGGGSWALLTEFPSVAVWDMKGQDNEIVMATHGRGIWTAELPVDQNANFPVPQIVASGTSPQSKFKVQIHLPSKYDSVQMIIGSQSVTLIPPDSGTYIVTITNVPTGSLQEQLIGYKKTAPIYSLPYSAVNLKLNAYQQQYNDFFITMNNFYSDGFSLLPFGNSNTSMQSQHEYVSGQDASGTLLTPIIVSTGSNASFIYDDVAIVQPGAAGSVFGQASFNDYVVAEATKDGLNWTPVANGYNASAQASWLAAYTSNQAGSQSLTVTETFDLKNSFSPKDTLLIRFRLHANSHATTGWGWSVDNLYIQQTPTGTEPSPVQTSVYPNPSTGKIFIGYSLSKSMEVSVTVWDMTGRNVSAQSLGYQSEGSHQTELNLESSMDGVYLVRIKSDEGEKIMKVIVKR